MSLRPGTVGQIVIQAPRIAVDVELQSGHARSHQCETSSSIIASPAHKTFRFCEVCLFDCSI